MRRAASDCWRTQVRERVNKTDRRVASLVCRPTTGQHDSHNHRARAARVRVVAREQAKLMYRGQRFTRVHGRFVRCAGDGGQLWDGRRGRVWICFSWAAGAEHPSIYSSRIPKRKSTRHQRSEAGQQEITSHQNLTSNMLCVARSLLQQRALSSRHSQDKRCVPPRRTVCVRVCVCVCAHPDVRCTPRRETT